MHLALTLRLLLLSIPAMTASSASSQCANWSRGFEIPGVSGSVHATCLFDDGGGTALFVGGAFSSVGATPASNIARWDGTTWSALSDEFDSTILALAVYDDGTGPALYAGGAFTQIGTTTGFNGIAKWNGSTWSPLGMGKNGLVSALQVFDAGSGPALYVGGSFFEAGPLTVHNVARWDGTAWSALGNGLTGNSSSTVETFAVYDSGSGPSLYAGGDFDSSSTTAVTGIARWTGTQWVGVGGGLGPFGSVHALSVFDDGSGPGLYAGGDFQTAGGITAFNIARWNGTNWSSLGNGVFGSISPDVSALAVFDDGTGAALYAAGGFTNAGGQPAERFARWNGSAWTPLPGFPPQSNERVHTLEPYSIGGSARLFAGGSFHRAGDVPVQGFAAWSNGAWSSIGTGNGCDANVLAFQVHDDGTGHGNRLYAAGQFHFAGATNSSGVAAWNGTSWSALGAGIVVDSSLYSVRALATHDEGAGARLFAGGDFYSAGGVSVTNVARWDGSAWSALGNGPNTGVRALASWDDGSGPALYVRGTFTHVGGVPAEGVARWDGSTWSIMSPGIGGPVFSFLLWDDGSGRALYVGAGSGGNARLVKWTGQAWIALPAPPMAFVAALAAYDDGSGAGERLYVAGPFFGIGPTNVARLDGATWTPVGGRVGEIADPVSALMVFDDGTGPALYVAGRFTRAGSAAANNIARLRGGVWHELSSGTDQWVQSLGVFDDGTGPALFAGGFFTTAGSKPSRHIAKLRAPSTTGTSICFGDGLDPMQTAQCPCGNTGLPSHGCANSSFQGAQLCATDSATPHSVQLTASGILPATNALLFAGTGVQTTGAVFGDGVRCVFGFLRRLDTRLPTGSSVTYDVAGDPSGTTTYYQVLYRNFQSFCTPAAFNVTNATRVIW